MSEFWDLSWLGRIKDPWPITKLRDLIIAALNILEQHVENKVGVRFMLNINKQIK